MGNVSKFGRISNCVWFMKWFSIVKMWKFKESRLERCYEMVSWKG